MGVGGGGGGGLRYFFRLSVMSYFSPRRRPELWMMTFPSMFHPNPYIHGKKKHDFTFQVNRRHDDVVVVV